MKKRGESSNRLGTPRKGDPEVKRCDDRLLFTSSDAPTHRIIEGENLYFLDWMLQEESGTIDCIYIDPPYNTGGRDFKYRDSFGGSHQDWTIFMRERLERAKGLLRSTGVIICHIDEKEYDRLRILFKEIWGENNDLGTIVWNKRNPKGDARGVAQQHEYIVCYAQDKEAFLNLNGALKRKKKNAVRMMRKARSLYQNIGKQKVPNAVAEWCKKYGYTKKQLQPFRVRYDLAMVNQEYRTWLKAQSFSGGERAYDWIDEQGRPFQTVSMSWPNKKRPSKDYFVPLYHPINGKPCPVPVRGWRNTSATMKQLLGTQEPVFLSNGMVLKGEIVFSTNRRGENNQPRRKYLLSDNLLENTPSILDYAGSDDALFRDLGIDFPYAKPVGVAMYLLQAIHPCPRKVLDFFAGSGTTLHAVMKLNAQREEKISCILATNNENGIADTCYHRIQMVHSGYNNQKGERVDGLSKSNICYERCALNPGDGR
ncbi:MAG: DNA methyltransferase [Myxococcota bacterium]|nr:DNA methyltransferase [Myxococcota bacterium]